MVRPATLFRKNTNKNEKKLCHHITHTLIVSPLLKSLFYCFSTNHILNLVSSVITVITAFPNCLLALYGFEVSLDGS